jgi:hypothetical protein
MVFKIYQPLPDVDMVMIYNEDKSYYGRLKPDPKIINLLKQTGLSTIYVNGEVDSNGKLHIDSINYDANF